MWLSLGLSCLLCSASWINGFMSLDKFGKFSTMFLQVLFQPHPISPFWLRLWWHKYLSFCSNPMGPWGYIHFFFLFSSLFLDLVIYVVFQFTDTPIPILLLILSIEFFIPVAEYFSPKISTFFFFIVFIFLGLYISFLRLSIFRFVSILLVFIHWSILLLLL